MATLKLSIRVRKGQKGEVPVYVTYAHNQKTTYFETGEKVKPDQWIYDGKKRDYFIDRTIGVKKVVGNEDLIKDLEKQNASSNAVIKKKLAQLSKIKSDWEYKHPGESLSIEDFRMLVEAEKNATPSSSDVLPLFKEYIEANKAQRSPNTIKGYNTAYSTLAAFVEKKKYKLSLKTINLDFYDLYKKYLVEEHVQPDGTIGLLNNSVGGHIKNLKAFLNYLRKRGHEINVQVKDFKILKERKEVIFHTSDEIEKIKTLIIPETSEIKNLYSKAWKESEGKYFPTKETLEEVRDLHLLTCFTGFRISDRKRLGMHHKGAKVIKMQALKNQKPVYVPVTAESKPILEKYDYNLPQISDQKFNEYVKCLCFLAGIDNIIEVPENKGKKIYTKYKKYQLISSHVGVSTFITLSAQKGISPKTIAQITGKTVKVILDHYYGSDEDFVQSEMERAYGSADHLKVS